MLAPVIIVCVVVAVALIVYAFIALPAELAAQKEVKNTAQALVAAIQTAPGGGPGLGGAVQQQALSAGTDFVKALATLGDSMSKLRSGTAAILIAFGLLVFSGMAAGVDDKVADAQDTPAAGATSRTPK
jgi:hypothetical protein